MTALNAKFVSPKDRVLAEVVQVAARLSYIDLVFLAQTANAIYSERLEAQLRSAEFAAQQPPEPDPHGV